VHHSELTPGREMLGPMRMRGMAVAGACVVVGLVGAACSSGPSTSGSTTTTTQKSTTTTTAAATTTSVTSPPTTTAPAGVAACTSSHLSATLGQFQGAAGTEGVPIIFTNTGLSTCTLQGYPGVSLVGANGVQLGSPAVRQGTGPGPLVQLAPNQTTTAQYLQPIGGAYNCTLITAMGLRIYPPNQTGALFAPSSGLMWCSAFPSTALQIYPIGEAIG
jgi:hypothetical protein